jgi:hypothetical protein
MRLMIAMASFSSAWCAIASSSEGGLTLNFSLCIIILTCFDSNNTFAEP